MINLLPPDEKKKILSEKSLRMISVLVIVISASLICLFLILLSINIFISGKTEALSQLKVEKIEIPKVKKEIMSINSKLSQIDSFYQEQIDFVEILEKILVVLPDSLYLNRLNLKPIFEGEERFEVSLVGFCPEREILYDFQKTLLAKENFGDVYFPLSTWMKPNDIDFQLKFKIK